MKYRLAVFDMDGTILNTLDDLADSLNYSLKLYEYTPRTIDEVRCFVGNGIKKLIERGVPKGTSPQDVEKVFSTFCEYYKLHCADKTKPYEGINFAIKSLRERGYKTAVVSNKADFAVKELSQDYFPGLFDIAIGENEAGGVRKKPAPDSVNTVLSTLGIKREEAVYFGDSEVDIATAANSGIDCITVTWGFRDIEFLKKNGGKIFASTTDELLHLL